LLMGATVILAAMKRREDQIINDFRAVGATSAVMAKTPAEIGLDDSRAVNRLRGQSIVREASAGRLYLDEAVLKSVRTRRLRMVWAFLIILLLVLAAIRLGLIKS
jgi:hypothetical protein